MEKNKSKRFVIGFLVGVFSFLLLIGTTAYLIDPFFQYRVKDHQYLLNPIYVNPGLAKNLDYNTVIIGSSMVQNYDLSILRQDPSIKPIKLASGAMTIREMKLLYSLIDLKKTNTVIFNFDMIQFNEWLPASRYPSYLYDQNILDKLQYLFAYESTVRFGLADALLTPYMKSHSAEERSQKINIKTSVDDIGSFVHESIYEDEARIKQMYREGRTVSNPSLYQINSRIKENIDILLATLHLEGNKDKQYIFVLPPYSALYWHITKRDGYFYHLTNNIKHLCRMTDKYKNVRIQFFYNLDQITDLNKYSDVTHYDPSISNYILKNLFNDEYRITKENMEQKIKEFDSKIIQYREDNKDWILN